MVHFWISLFLPFNKCREGAVGGPYGLYVASFGEHPRAASQFGTLQPGGVPPRKNSTQAFKPMTLRLLKNSAWVVCEVCKTGDEFCVDEIVILFAQFCFFFLIAWRFDSALALRLSLEEPSAASAWSMKWSTRSSFERSASASMSRGQPPPPSTPEFCSHL